MRKTSYILFLLGLLLTGTAAFAQTASVHIGEMHAPEHGQVYIPVYADFTNTDQGVSGFDWYIQFDPAVLQFTGVDSVHTLLADALSASLQDNKPGTLQISWIDFSFENPLLMRDTLLYLIMEFSGSDCHELSFIEGSGYSELIDPVGLEIPGVTFHDAVVCLDDGPRRLAIIVEPSHITSLANPRGAGNSYQPGDIIEVGVDEVPGFEFIGWLTNPELMDSLADPSAIQTTFSMPQRNVTLTASYKPIPYSIHILITPDSLSGYANPEGTGEAFIISQEVCISVDAVVGYRFSEWEAASPDDLDLLPEPEALQNCFAMPPRNLEFTAVYEPIPYALKLVVDPEELTLQANPQGSGQNYFMGQVIPISVREVPGFAFSGWTTENEDDQSLIGDPEAMSTNLTMPAGPVTLTASYTEIPPTVFSISFSVLKEHGGSVQDATITLNDSTNPAGEYTFAELLPGLYTYNVSKQGFLDSGDLLLLEDQDLVVEVVLKIDDVSVAESTLPGIRVFPNPARNIVFIEAESSIKFVQLINMQGQECASIQASGASSTSLNTGGFPDGNYFLRIHTKSGTVTQQIKLIR